VEERPRLAVYWASGCGGCEAVFLDLGDRLLEIAQNYEISFFPLLCDTKLHSVEGFHDGAVDFTLITGAVRTTHDVAMVRTLRRVSKRLIAMGACSQLGSVVGLGNLTSAAEIMHTVYDGSDRSGKMPRNVTLTASGSLELGGITEWVRPLDSIVPVDYAIPGCPPEADRLWEVLQLLRTSLVGDVELPGPGAVLGARDGTVCEECPLPQPEGPTRSFFRMHQVAPSQELCLLDQGLICSGPATRGGCGALCPAAGAGCRGCYGGPPGIYDQGARMMAALAALAGTGDGEAAETKEEQLRKHVEAEVSTLVDPVGTLYRYSFPVSLLARLGQEEDES